MFSFSLLAADTAAWGDRTDRNINIASPTTHRERLPMNKSLLIATVSPDDDGGSSSGRRHKIATQGRFLQDHGWEQTVGQIPRGRYLPFGIARCLRRGYENDIGVVHSISEPIHLHVAGFIVSRILDCPWVAHSRDSMIVNKARVGPNSVEGWLRAKIEHLVAVHADAVLWDQYGGMVPEGYFEAVYPGVDSEKFVRLPPIGFVSEAFESASAEEFSEPTMTFAGRFYDSLEPYDLLDGFAEYLERDDARSVCFRVYGDWNDAFENYCAELGIEEAVETYDWISHETLIRKLKGSDLLVHIGGTNSEHENHIGTKVYDYIGARTPILVVGDPSFEVASIVEENDLGIAVHNDDPDSIANAIETFLSDSYDFNPDAEIRNEFSRETRIELLSTVFDTVYN
jgi:glycosyltransferase involved in cell wall biosynthesis